MTVKELILALQQFPENFKIVTQGYEGGLQEIKGICATKIVENYYSSDYMGEHEEKDNVYPCDEEERMLYDSKTTYAIFLSRKPLRIDPIGYPSRTFIDNGLFSPDSPTTFSLKKVNAFSNN
jgi:hypothetical protein